VNVFLGAFLDGDLGKWESRAWPVALAAAGVLAKFAFDRFIRRWDAAQVERAARRKAEEKLRRKDHHRLWQHDKEIVNGLRNGVPFDEEEE